MDRGIYAASSGGLYSSRRLQIVGNNLANVNTVGYKAQRLVSRQQSFEDTLASKLSTTDARAKEDHARSPGVTDIETLTDFTQGPISHTGNPLNVALTKPNQFFVINTEAGETYTRAGNFTLNGNGELVTQDGKQVVGSGGPIVLGRGAANISSNGTVTANGVIAGRIRVVEIENPEIMERTEGVRFRLGGANEPTPVNRPELVSNSVELPNVNVISAMVEMIATQKSFEMYQKSAQSISEMNEEAIRNARLTG